ncbi:hypothetical protein BU15DRAFT_53532 [Melanogaster broomeanus]|nr:hypothetical protein BU15DRAFT_53532 [Melanogaster broomeanus]
MPTFPYVIINAFTRTSLGGNPAAIVLLPPGSLAPNRPTSTPILDDPTMIALTKSFAQPITVFLSSSPPQTQGDDAPAFDVRYFSNDFEPLVCGHGTLAATKAICRGLLPGLKKDVAWDPVVKFRTASGAMVSARALPPFSSSTAAADDEEDGEYYELELPTNTVEELTGSHRDCIRAAIAKSLRKDTTDLGLKYVARGAGKMSDYLMVVLDETEKLQDRDIDINALIGPFNANILTHLTPNEDSAFVSRVFDPLNGIMEDHVCGTAHTLLTPYYATIASSGVRAGQEVYVRQVGPRGGDLWVTLDDAKGVVRLKGNSRLFSTGEVRL